MNMKIYALAATGILCLAAIPANAQSVVKICVLNTANSGCTPVDTNNPLPVTSGGDGGGNVNLTGVNGVTPTVNTGAAAAGSLRVTNAQDTSTVSGAAPLTTGIYVTGPSAAPLATGALQTTGNTSAAASAAALGTTADSVCGTATGTCTIEALIKFLNTVASTTTTHYTGSLTNTAVAVDASPGNLYGYYLDNPNASECFVQFYNTAQGSVTVGTTAPVLSLGIPAGGAANLTMANADAFSTAITIAATTTRAGGTACGSNISANVWYK